MMPKLPPLSADLQAGWLYATGFSALATIPLLILGVYSAYQSIAVPIPELTFGHWFLMTIAVIASYFAAGTLAGLVFWLTRWLRPGLVGTVLSGMLITPIVYTTVALSGYLAWNPVGRTLFGRHGESRDDFLHAIPALALLFSLVGIIFGLVTWYQRDKVSSQGHG